MGRVLTNNISLAYAAEQTIGVLPGSPLWKLIEPNSIGAFGATITTVPRAPISKSRQRRKGTVTDLDSAVEYEADWTLDSFGDFISGFLFAKHQNSLKIVDIHSGTLAEQLAAVAATPGYSHTALNAALVQNTLVFVRGFSNASNNGLKTVTAGSTTTSTKISGGPAIVNETPNTQANASLEVAGFHFTDLTWTDASNQIASAGVDLTTLGLSVGQFIRVGGAASFTNGSIYGRIVSITAGIIVLDKITNIGTGTLDGGGNAGASTVDVHYGRFYKNVVVGDADYVEKSFQFEAAFPNLAAGPVTGYEYAKGNMCNEVTFTLPLADKATVGFAFVGTDTEVPVTVQKTNAATPQNPVKTTALNTSADIARLRIAKIDETGITTDFKTLSLKLGNNVSPEKVLGTLGAKYMNTGNFEVDIEAEALFTDPAVVDAIRNNTTVAMDFGVKNDDGAVFVDIPSMTIGNGGKSFPVNESVTIQLTGMAFKDPTLGTSIGVSVFPYLP
jgi:hypothetical protein